MSLTKRLSALLLAVVMVASLMPTSAYAENDQCTTPDVCSSEGHVAGCDLYVAVCPGNESCTVAEGHIEGCPSYVAPSEPDDGGVSNINDNGDTTEPFKPTGITVDSVLLTNKEFNVNVTGSGSMDTLDFIYYSVLDSNGDVVYYQATSSSQNPATSKVEKNDANNYASTLKLTTAGTYTLNVNANHGPGVNYGYQKSITVQHPLTISVAPAQVAVGEKVTITATFNGTEDGTMEFLKDGESYPATSSEGKTYTFEYTATEADVGDCTIYPQYLGGKYIGSASFTVTNGSSTNPDTPPTSWEMAPHVTTQTAGLGVTFTLNSGYYEPHQLSLTLYKDSGETAYATLNNFTKLSDFTWGYEFNEAGTYRCVAEVVWTEGADPQSKEYTVTIVPIVPEDGNVVIPAPSDATATSNTISAKVLDAIKDAEDVTLTVIVPGTGAKVTFNAAATAKIAEGSNVTLSVAKASVVPEGEADAFDISLTGASFDVGNAAVELPLPEALKNVVDLIVTYYDDDGVAKETYPATGNGTTFTVTLSHFSTYAVKAKSNTTTTYAAMIGNTGYETLAAALDAVPTGEKTTITLSAGTYKFPTGSEYSKSLGGKIIVFKADKDATLDATFFNVNATQNLIGADLTFDGVNVNFPASSWYQNGYTGLNMAGGKLTFNNSTISGAQYLYVPTAVFTNCTFNVEGSNYAVCTYAASDVTFDGCTFNTDGKAVLVYNDYAVTTDVTVTGCSFEAKTNRSKAAVEVGQSPDNAAKYTLNITNSTADDNFVANNSTSNLWGNKDDMDWKDLNTVIDGEDKTTPRIAEIDGKIYGSLEAAFAAVKDGETIKLLDNLTLDNWTSVNMDAKGFTLDGNKKTISGLKCALIDSITTGGKTVVIKDLTISGASNAGLNSNHSGVVNAGGLVNVAGYVNLTISNVHVINSTIGGSDTYYAGGLIGYVGATESSVLNISGCSVTGTSITGDSSVGGLFGHSNGGLTTITGTSVGGNTLEGGSEAKEGSLIGTLTGSVGTKIAVTEDSKSSGSGTLNVIGRVYTGVTYTGGEYFTNPQVASETDENTAIAVSEGYEFVEQAGGSWKLEKLPDVAKIGETGYPTIQAAIDAANAGDTITLLENVSETGIKVGADDEIILDLNDKTLTGDIFSEGKLTVKNGTINSNEFVSAIESSGTAADLTLGDDVIVTSQRHALRIEGGTATINGGTYSALGRTGQEETVHALNAGGALDTVVTINGGTFNGIKFDGNAETPDSGAALNVQNMATVTVKGGSFQDGQNETVRVTGTGAATIYAGTFDQDPRVTGVTIPKVCKVTEADGKWTVTEHDPVAEFNGVEYCDLAEALADLKAAGSGKIELLSDVKVENWTAVNMGGIFFEFDGKGHTITGLTDPLISDIGSTAHEDLQVTIKNLTISGANINSSRDYAGALIAQVQTNVTLTVSGVHVNNSTVKSKNFTGGLIGMTNGGKTITVNVTGSSVKNTTVEGPTAGGVLGIHYAPGKVSATVSNNTMKGEKAVKEGSIIGNLMTDVTMDVTEESQSKSTYTNPPYLIGRLNGTATYDNVSSYINPELFGEGSGKAVPAEGKEFVVGANGMYKLDTLPASGNMGDVVTEKTITITWDDNNDSRGIRPSQIKLVVYRDDVQIETITVEEQDGNTWKAIYEAKKYELPKTRSADLPREYDYTIKPSAVSGYTTTCTKNGDAFTITNTIKPLTIYTYSPDKLLQTGAEVMPIGMMAFGGICLLAVSMWLLRKKSYGR